jgi:hypothetical protein
MTTPKFRPAKVVDIKILEVEVEFLDTGNRVKAEAVQEFQLGEVVAVTDSPRARSYRFDYEGTLTAHKLKGEII